MQGIWGFLKTSRMTRLCYHISQTGGGQNKHVRCLTARVATPVGLKYES